VTVFWCNMKTSAELDRRDADTAPKTDKHVPRDQKALQSDDPAVLQQLKMADPDHRRSVPPTTDFRVVPKAPKRKKVSRQRKHSRSRAERAPAPEHEEHQSIEAASSPVQKKLCSVTPKGPFAGARDIVIATPGATTVLHIGEFVTTPLHLHFGGT